MYTIMLIVFTAGAAILNSNGFQDTVKESSGYQSFCNLLRLNDSNIDLETIDCGKIFSFWSLFIILKVTLKSF